MPRQKTPNPFTRNPFSYQDSVTLVAIPEAPETHERRKPLRAYLGAGDNPIDRLITTIMGGTPRTPRKVEVIREVREAEAEDVPPVAEGAPPRYGRT